MPDRSKFLVIGASGLLGRHVTALLDPQRAVATYRSHPAAGGAFFDASTMRLRDTLLRGDHGFHAAFVLYGITKVDACALDPAGTSAVNVASIKNAIDDLIDAGVKPVFASSDAVFDGSRGMRTETDPTRPILAYGRQKLEVEEYLRAKNAPWVIARLSKLVSPLAEPRNLLTDWAEKLERDENIRCASDLIFSPADVNDAAQALVSLAEGPSTGLFHVCGPQAMSWLDLFNVFVQKVGAHKAVHPNMAVIRMADLQLAQPRPLDSSMQPAKLYAALGRSFRRMDVVCSEFAASRYGRQPAYADAR
jgi:dTDP-4-dehydrorhamnose reductase